MNKICFDFLLSGPGKFYSKFYRLRDFTIALCLFNICLLISSSIAKFKTHKLLVGFSWDKHDSLSYAQLLWLCSSMYMNRRMCVVIIRFTWVWCFINICSTIKSSSQKLYHKNNKFVCFYHKQDYSLLDEFRVI